MFSKVTCEVCRERPATIFITRVDGGQQHEQHLCETCARAQTGGTEWLQAIARKFNLPEDASLDEVMRNIADKMPLGFDPEGGFIGSDAGELEGLEIKGFSVTGMNEDEIPNLILEANLQFSQEFPADEDEVDDLDEAWQEMENSGMDLSLESLKAAMAADGEMEAAVEPTGSAKELSGERCPKCGTTWDRLREDGRAGCAQCYVAFHDRLNEIMARMQRDTQHVGKTPRAALKRQRRLEHLRARRDNRLAMLNRRLQEAVAAENFEDAAKLRDKIKIVASTIVSDEG